MIDPPRWTNEQLEADRLRAIDNFRQERLHEPLEAYLQAFDNHRGSVQELLAETGDLSEIDEAALKVLTDARLLEAFRYLDGPPISADDLKTLADASSLSPSGMRRRPGIVQRIIEVVLLALDRRRFPWVDGNREPTETEREAAVVASAALLATSHIATRRRTEGKTQQEQRVVDALARSGFTKVESRTIAHLSSVPHAGEFCAESQLGSAKSDFVIGLWDQRVMPVECKVSNSAVNSVKRLNREASGKAEVWRRDFGERHVVPAAVLSGVYKLHNLIEAQQRGLTLFWAHDLDVLLEWVRRTQTR